MLNVMPPGRLFEQLSAMHPELTAFRRDLHAHPELGFEEVRTSARVAEALRVCGVDEVHTGIAKTGAFALEKIYRLLRLSAEPPTTRFVVSQLSTSHWYDIAAAKRDLGYTPAVSLEDGLRRLAISLKGVGSLEPQASARG